MNTDYRALHNQYAQGMAQPNTLGQSNQPGFNFLQGWSASPHAGYLPPSQAQQIPTQYGGEELPPVQTQPGAPSGFGATSGLGGFGGASRPNLGQQNQSFAAMARQPSGNQPRPGRGFWQGSDRAAQHNWLQSPWYLYSKPQPIDQPNPGSGHLLQPGGI